MIEYKEVKKVVKEKCQSKNKANDIEFIIGRYNNIMNLNGKDKYIWFDWITQTCSSMSDLEQSIAVGVKEYTSCMFDIACKIIKPERLDLPSAYAAIANWLRKNDTGMSDEELKEMF